MSDYKGLILKLIASRGFRFLIVGSGGALAYVVLSYLLYLAGLQQWEASAVVYLSLIPIMFLLQKHLVFRSEVPSGKSFLRYAVIQVAGVLTAAVLPVFMERAGIHPLVSFVLVMTVSSLISFFLQLRWAFATYDAR